MPNSSISQQCALTFIKYYRQNFPDNICSVWINSDIITAIQQSAEPISGIRVYFAQYQAGTACDLAGQTPDSVTAILALTTTVGGVQTDLQNGYFDYGNPCPPSCQGDIDS